MLGADEPRWRRLAGAVRRNYWGGDCYAHGLLALGQIDVIAETTMKLWDWAALVPVVEGAGGRVTDWSGQTLRPDGDGQGAGGGRSGAAARRSSALPKLTVFSCHDPAARRHIFVPHARHSPPAADRPDLARPRVGR